MIVTEEVGNKVVTENYIGGFCLREIEFQKMHIEVDKHWDVVFEQPFTEVLFLISFDKQQLWLNADQLSALKALLD